MKDPTDGKEVVDRLFPHIQSAISAAGYSLEAMCESSFRKGTPSNPRGNEEGFGACLKFGNWSVAEPALIHAATQHGVIAVLAQKLHDYGDSAAPKIVSFAAFEAAGVLVRKLCAARCDNTRGQWCTWP